MTAKDERRVMSRLIDEFGAEILVNLTPPPSRRPRERAKVRADAVNQALGCRACGLCEQQAVSDPRGPAYPSQTGAMDLTILTAYPMDPKSRHTRTILSAVTPHVDRDRIAWVSVVSCVPRSNGSLRRASKLEVTACEANLHRALDAAGAPNVLIVGEDALVAWRPGLRVDRLDGIVGVWRNTWCVTAVIHPASIRFAAERKEWTHTAGRAVWMLTNGTVAGIGERCLHRGCDRPFFAWDQDALPWCEQHLKPVSQRPVRDFVDRPLWAS